MKYILYKISIANYTYIGSTKDWKQRQQMHKSNCFNTNSPAHNYKLYQTIRANGGWHLIEKTPIEEIDVEGPIQAHICEERWRRHYDAQLNMRRAHITEEERIQYNTGYFAEHRDQKHAYYAARYTATRDQTLARSAEKIQCECGATICRGAKSQHIKSKKHTDLIAAQQQNITV